MPRVQKRQQQRMLRRTAAVGPWRRGPVVPTLLQRSGRRPFRAPIACRRGLASGSSGSSGRATHDEAQGVAVLRRATSAGSLGGALAESTKAWAEAALGPTPPAFHVVHVHDADLLTMEGGGGGGGGSRPGGSGAPVVAVTAEPNALDIDLSSADDEDLRLVSLTKTPKRPRRARPRRTPRTMEELKEMEEAEKQQQQQEEREVDEGGDASPLDATSTATVVSVGSPAIDAAVLFRAQDASFPDIPGCALVDMLKEGGRQPHVFLFAHPGFPLVELATRLETVFNKAHVVATYGRGVHGGLPRVVGVGGGGDGSAGEEGAKEESDAWPAVGLAVFGDRLTTAQVGRMACAVLGSSWLGDFCLDSVLQRELFVPGAGFRPGPQPACEWYRDVPNEPAARDLPLFRLRTVLYPGCSMVMKVFEPRYRRMVKRCLERREPFGLVHAGATVGTLCYVSEVFSMDAQTGVSVVKVTGYRRFSIEATAVPPDSFGLLVAKRAAFFEEEPCAPKEGRKEVEDLLLQARACLRLQHPGDGADGAAAGATSSSNNILPEGECATPEGAVAQSFYLSQYLLDQLAGGQGGLSDARKIEWLATTSTADRLRDCLDLLLAHVRKGGRAGAGAGLGTRGGRAATGGGGGDKPLTL